MEIILSKNCESLTGSVGRGFSYHIQHRKNGYFGKRNSKGYVPHDGHWRFIVACAKIAQKKLYIKDIRVPSLELDIAIVEAGKFAPVLSLREQKVYNAADVLQLKKTFGL